MHSLRMRWLLAYVGIALAFLGLGASCTKVQRDVRVKTVQPEEVNMALAPQMQFRNGLSLLSSVHSTTAIEEGTEIMARVQPGHWEPGWLTDESAELIAPLALNSTSTTLGPETVALGLILQTPLVFFMDLDLRDQVLNRSTDDPRFQALVEWVGDLWNQDASVVLTAEAQPELFALAGSISIQAIEEVMNTAPASAAPRRDHGQMQEIVGSANEIHLEWGSSSNDLWAVNPKGIGFGVTSEPADQSTKPIGGFVPPKGCLWPCVGEKNLALPTGAYRVTFFKGFNIELPNHQWLDPSHPAGVATWANTARSVLTFLRAFAAIPAENESLIQFIIQELGTRGLERRMDELADALSTNDLIRVLEILLGLGDTPIWKEVMRRAFEEVTDTLIDQAISAGIKMVSGVISIFCGPAAPMCYTALGAGGETLQGRGFATWLDLVFAPAQLSYEIEWSKSPRKLTQVSFTAPPSAVIRSEPAKFARINERTTLIAITDPPSSALEFRWDVDGNGNWDFDWSKSDSIVWTYTTAGNISIILQVRDRAGQTATARLYLSVVGRPHCGDGQCEAGETEVSCRADCGRACLKPTAPTMEPPSAGDGTVAVCWKQRANESYVVYRGTETGSLVSKTRITSSALSTACHTDIGLTNGRTYYYQVTGNNGCGEGTPSAEVSATPSGPTTVLPAPTGLSATAGDASVSLSWNNVAHAVSYKVYYGTSSGNLVSSKDSSATSTSVTGLTNGTRYYFSVAGIDGSGKVGEKSGEVSATPTASQRPDNTPPTFSGLSSATAVSTSQIDLSWAAATDDRSPSSSIIYRICQSTTSGTCQKSFSATYTTNAGVTSYSATGLTAATTYYFVARAMDEGSNEDANTTEVSATTQSISTPPTAGSYVQCNNNTFECCVKEAYDCMIVVPASTFVQGSKPGEGYANEGPRRLVTLSEYYIDKYEVTNANYKVCVKVAACTSPGYKAPSYYGGPPYDNFPVTNMARHQATEYCTWKERRLPTEAEWEKAARGPADGSLVGLTSGQCTTADAAGTGTDTNCNLRPYPWGGTITTTVPYATGTDCTKLNYNKYYEIGNVSSHCVGDAITVGSRPAGASLYGVLDLAGNVWEWVQDWYDGLYYSSAPDVNPPGPTTGKYRVIRGGSWDEGSLLARSVSRSHNGTPYAYDSIGFRCAKAP